ncbi:MAG: TAXI family TRAP transporter solute-binding subunit [Candidatus Cloacimonetes bacterium]|nr:TAXI family TRAP transporter solute-binding subunit [Candidatus Cloacimonadota bacterium]
MKKIILPLVVIAIIVSCTQTKVEFPEELIIGSGPSGGTWFTFGKLLEQLYSDKLTKTVSIPGGGVKNVIALNENDIDLGFSTAVLGKAAIEGYDPFKTAQTNVSCIGNLYKQYLYCIVRTEYAQNNDVVSIDDIFIKKLPVRLGVLTQGTVSEYITKNILIQLGTSYEDIVARGGKVEFDNYTTGAIHLVENAIDVFIFMASSPADIVTDMENEIRISILPCSKDLRDKMRLKLGTISHELKKHTYKSLFHDTHVIGDYTVLLVRNSLSAEQVTALAKTLFSNTKALSTNEKAIEQIEAKNAFTNTGFPLHPGAEQYFKNCGLWDE